MKREVGDSIEDIISAMEIPPLKPIFERILGDLEE